MNRLFVYMTRGHILLLTFCSVWNDLYMCVLIFDILLSSLYCVLKRIVFNITLDESPATNLLPSSNESHEDYFQNKNGLRLDYPAAKPMLVVLGRKQSTIFPPEEFVCGNELDINLQSRLPLIESFDPSVPNLAFEEMKRYLKPGGQKTKGTGGGLLPALGIVLGED